MQTDNVELRTIVLTCANTLLTSLLSLTGSPTSMQIPDSFMEKINLQYSDLESCDYIGMCDNITEWSTRVLKMNGASCTACN